MKTIRNWLGFLCFALAVSGLGSIAIWLILHIPRI